MKEFLITLCAVLAITCELKSQIVVYSYNKNGGCISRQLKTTRNIELYSDLIEHSASVEFSHTPDYLTIIISNLDENAYLEFKVLDICNSIVLFGYCKNGTNNIEISTLPSGIYIVYIDYAESPFSYKFIKS